MRIYYKKNLRCDQESNYVMTTMNLGERGSVKNNKCLSEMP